MPSGAKKRKAAKRKKETVAISVDAPFGFHDQACFGRGEDDFINHDEKNRGNGNPTSPSLQAQYLAHSENHFPVEKDETRDVCVERAESLGEEANGGTTSGADSEDHSLERVSELGVTPILKSDADMMTQELVPQQTRDPKNESTMNSLLKVDDDSGVPSSEKVIHNQTEGISWPGNRKGSDNQKVLIPISVRETSWKSCCGLFELIYGFKK